MVLTRDPNRPTTGHEAEYFWKLALTRSVDTIRLGVISGGGISRGFSPLFYNGRGCLLSDGTQASRAGRVCRRLGYGRLASHRRADPAAACGRGAAGHDGRGWLLRLGRRRLGDKAGWPAWPRRSRAWRRWHGWLEGVVHETVLGRRAADWHRQRQTQRQWCYRRQSWCCGHLSHSCTKTHTGFQWMVKLKVKETWILR